LTRGNGASTVRQRGPSIRWEESTIVDGLKLLGQEQDAEIEALVKRLFAGGTPNDADLDSYNAGRGARTRPRS
jgi:hypothetical protein